MILILPYLTAPSVSVKHDLQLIFHVEDPINGPKTPKGESFTTGIHEILGNAMALFDLKSFTNPE